MQTKNVKLFISYKRHIEPDDRLAHQIYEALNILPTADVFMDFTMGIGVEWAQQIEQEIKAADYFIAFLSAASVQSEMVGAEIETAHHWCKQHGNPKIFPIRVNYEETLEYPLSAYLNSLNWGVWKSDADTPMLVSKLIAAISATTDGMIIGQAITSGEDTPEHEQPTPPPAPSPIPNHSAQPFELPEGTMRPDSQYYIERNGDRQALDAIQRDGVTITIKGPRQIGKSSLLMRIMDQAKAVDKQPVFIDFQLFDGITRSDPEKFFKRFTRTIVRKLKLPNEIDAFWDEGLGHSQLCTEYLEDYILPNLEKPVVLAMDEVESVFETSFRSDFFSMLRSWTNSGSSSLEWRKINLALVTSTEPYQFIDDLNQSPFNVGVIINIEDFTPAQVAIVNDTHRRPLADEQVIALHDLLNGHPYLTRRAIYLISSNQISYSELMQTACEWSGPFGDHLRYHLFRLQRSPDFVKAMKAIAAGPSKIDENIFHRLQGAGVVKRSQKGIVSRCKLYEQFFNTYLGD